MFLVERWRRNAVHFTRSVSKVLDHEHAHRAGAAAGVARCLDLVHQALEVLPFSRADLGKRIPQLWFQAHAGLATQRDDVPVRQSTAWHVSSHLLGCQQLAPTTLVKKPDVAVAVRAGPRTAGRPSLMVKE